MIIFHWLGRHATWVMPMGLVIGILFPALAAVAQSLLLPAVVFPLMLSIARVAWQGQLAALKRWQLLFWVSVWMLITAPILVWLVGRAANLPEHLLHGAVLAAAAPPVTACGALALLMKLDARITLITTLVTLLLCPLTIPPIALYLLNINIDLSFIDLMQRLGIVVAIALAGATVLKKALGQARIDRNASIIDGLSVIFISIFIIGMMDGILAWSMQQPLIALSVLLVSTLTIFGLNALSSLLFFREEPATALAIGLVSGQANLGLLYLTLADQVSINVLAFFALGQIPLYVLPMIERPIARYWLERTVQPISKLP
ncbi:hypothetical protein ACFOSD_12250 [Salinispirillum marinum]|uniref:Bile acid:sodium symporter n=2 Tax=Saccharospirillaceae TaxID=255527 RepID=A0ABV8BGQ6_9GAMM